MRERRGAQAGHGKKGRTRQPAQEDDLELDPSDDEGEEQERPRRKSKDRPLFQDEVVIVTRTRVLITDPSSGEATTYALANITSVCARVERPSWLAMVGLSMAVLGSLTIKLSAQVALGLIAVGIVMALLYWLLKPKHWVRVGTAGAETDAVYSRDPDWTQQVVEAINEAIISRG